MRILVLLATVAASLVGSAAFAQEPLDGYLIARKACKATVSIRNAASESGTTLEIDRAYHLIGENRLNGSHYYVVVPGTEPDRRWVQKTCGDWVKLVARADAFDRPGSGGSIATRSDDANGEVAQQGRTAESQTAGAATPSDAGAGGRDAQGGKVPRDLLLAISWQPAFCDTHQSKTECRSQTRDRFDADHFALHGLWPQPRGVEYCGVGAKQKSDDKAGDWDKLPPLEVDAETRAEMEKAMPGTLSMLDRHEWTRHGTCYATSTDEYFDDALAVLGKINGSKVRDLFAGAIGRTLTRQEIRAAFDEAFGAGAGERVRIACSRDGKRQLIGELTIGLVGEITPDPDVSGLIAAARPTDGGCNEGIVDAIGFQ
ncbi:ribonuclease T2 family protein [Jiella avicenniae]|uniref:Ribonuclease n=1 Tax=Jiella avicenniae TaxID=2907202 RepID=A0A9X1P6H5_9HYPH|nr:ribonuclease [Jiella avicenniae]MCE7030659.1 ribonuclease [Jiella avicenniae]